MKKLDFIIIAIFLLMALSLGIRNYKIDSNISEEKNVLVKVEGIKFGIYDLEANQKITIDLEHAFNIVEIEGGIVSISESDCQDQICVKTKGISKVGQSIICVPNRVSVEIIGESEDEIDAISR